MENPIKESFFINPNGTKIYHKYNKKGLIEAFIIAGAKKVRISKNNNNILRLEKKIQTRELI